MDNLKKLIGECFKVSTGLMALGFLLLLVPAFVILVELIYVWIIGAHLNLFLGPILGHFLVGVVCGVGCGFIVTSAIIDVELKDAIKRINREEGGKKRGTEKKT